MAGQTDLFGHSISYGYDRDGGLTATKLPDGDTITNTYDHADQLAGTVAASTAGGSAAYSLGYTRDADGQVTGQDANGVTQTFTYSSRWQLASSSGGPSGSGGTATYTLSAANQPTRVAGRTQTFDAPGQQCWSSTSAVIDPTCGTVLPGPATTQFLTVDPDLAATDQPHLYANGDLTNHTDMLGLCSSRLNAAEANGTIAGPAGAGATGLDEGPRVRQHDPYACGGMAMGAGGVLWGLPAAGIDIGANVPGAKLSEGAQVTKTVLRIQSLMVGAEGSDIDIAGRATRRRRQPDNRPSLQPPLTSGQPA